MKFKYLSEIKKILEQYRDTNPCTRIKNNLERCIWYIDNEFNKIDIKLEIKE